MGAQPKENGDHGATRAGVRIDRPAGWMSPDENSNPGDFRLFFVGNSPQALRQWKQARSR